jgi:hypothetical protein
MNYGSVTMGLLVLSAFAGMARGQASEAAPRDRVAQLVERLDAPKMEARKAAEEDLIKLGPGILPLLPETPKSASLERRERLDRVRAALRDAQDQTNLGASKVTILGKGIRLSEAIQRLQAQSGNPITDLREQMGDEVTNPALDLEIVERPFFEALDLIAKKAEVTPNFFTGDGSIGLTPGAAPTSSWVQYVGPFRIALKQVGALRDLQADTASANLRFEVAWEPRLRPMLLALQADELKIRDDRGEGVAPQVMTESTDTVLRPDNPAAEVDIDLAAPDRAAKALASVRVKANVTVPAALRTFRFLSLADKDVTKAQGGIRITLESTEVDEQVWKVNVRLAYPGEGESFESYRQGLFNNRLWLQKADGSRFEHNGGFSNTSSDQGRLGFEYLFVDAPGKPADYQLVYEAPCKVLAIPLEFEFKDVPLP